MPQDYDLKINGSKVGTLRGPIFGESPRSGNTAGFTQIGATGETPLPNFKWSDFIITLIQNSQLPSSIGPGDYTCGQDWKKNMSVTGKVRGPVNGNWVATAKNPNSQNSEYSLKIEDFELGTLVFDGVKSTLHYPENPTKIPSTVGVSVSWTTWEAFVITITTQNIWGFPPGTYNFTGGKFTRIAGVGYKRRDNNPREEPTSWEATARVVR